MTELLPNNPEAESALIGAVMHGVADFGLAAGVITGDDFFTEKHRRIWRAMEDLHSAGLAVEPVAVATALKDSGLLESIGGLSALIDFDFGLGHTHGIDGYCRIIREYGVRRKGIYACQKLAHSLQLGTDSSEAAEQAERLLRGLGEASQDDRRLMSIGEAIGRHGGPDQFFSRTRAKGIPLRWPTLNEMLGGLQKQQLIIVAARPSVGKTALALDLAEFAATSGYGTAVFSLEMSRDEQITRLACCKGQVDSNTVRQGRLRAEDRKRLALATMHLTELPLWIDDQAGCTVAAIHAAIRKLIAHHPIHLVVVDYLQLMDTAGRAGNRTEAVSAISRGLKLAAKEFDIPFVVLSQLTRGSEHEKRKPVLSDLRESGSIEQDADVVGFIHREQQAYGDVQKCSFILAKQRNGPIGEIDMDFHRRFTRFEEAGMMAQEAA